jgi:hypothetical protein
MRRLPLARAAARLSPLAVGAAVAGLALSGGLAVAPAPASAHRDGCHRWHSCPSDTGSYVCADLGYTSECPIAYSAPVRPRVVRAPAELRIGSFHSPSGNIRCVIQGSSSIAGASCVTLHNLRGAQVGAWGRAYRVANPDYIAPRSVLPYGRSTTRLSFRCTSSTAAMTCRDRRTGRGFAISRAGIRLF